MEINKNEIIIGNIDYYKLQYMAIVSKKITGENFKFLRISFPIVVLQARPYYCFTYRTQFGQKVYIFHSQCCNLFVCCFVKSNNQLCKPDNQVVKSTANLAPTLTPT